MAGRYVQEAFGPAKRVVTEMADVAGQVEHTLQQAPLTALNKADDLMRSTRGLHRGRGPDSLDHVA